MSILPIGRRHLTLLTYHAQHLHPNRNACAWSVQAANEGSDYDTVRQSDLDQVILQEKDLEIDQLKVQLEHAQLKSQLQIAELNEQMQEIQVSTSWS